MLAGEWDIGERLPSRLRLAEEYGVGRNVTQRAVDQLIGDGLLEGRAGSGTYVRVPRERLRLVRSRHPAHHGGSLYGAGVKERLCVTTHHEFLADGQPVQLSRSWDPMAITDGTPIVLPEEGPLAGKGVVERMRSLGVDVETVVEVPRPARATQNMWLMW